LQPDDPETVGSVYTLTAINPDTRLLISHVEGGRDTDHVILLFEDVEMKRDRSTPLPVFTTDNWDAFDEALITVYGRTICPEYNGREDRLYQNVCPLRT